MSAGRYAPQLLLPGWGDGVQELLRGSSVFVVGAGAIGGTAAAFVAGLGPGRLAIVDGSQVSEGEMARQVLHFTPEAGAGKADSAAAKLSLLNPDVHVDPFPADVTAENADAILIDADVVIDCSSRLDVRLFVNDACLRADKPFVSAAAGGLDGAVMAVSPGHGACCRCVEDVEAAGDAPGFRLPDRAAAGVYGPAAGALGALAAHLGLALLLGHANARPGQLQRFEGAHSRWSAQDVDRSADCICAKDSAAGNV